MPRAAKPGANSVVLQRDWGAEHRHDAVAGELVQRSAAALHHGRGRVQQFGHDFTQPRTAISLRHLRHEVLRPPYVVSFEAVVKGLHLYFLKSHLPAWTKWRVGQMVSSFVEFTRRASASIARVCGMPLDRHGAWLWLSPVVGSPQWPR